MALTHSSIESQGFVHPLKSLFPHSVGPPDVEECSLDARRCRVRIGAILAGLGCGWGSLPEDSGRFEILSVNPMIQVRMGQSWGPSVLNWFSETG